MIAFGFGILVYIVIPVLLLFVMNVLLSAASVLDPLHAGQHVKDLWTGFAVIFGFQAVFTLIICPMTVFIARIVVERFSRAARWLVAIAAGVAGHWLVMAVLGIPTFLITRDELFQSFELLFWLFTTISGPGLAVICVAVLARSSTETIANG